MLLSCFSTVMQTRKKKSSEHRHRHHHQQQERNRNTKKEVLSSSMYGLCACFMPQLNLIRSTSYTVLNREQWKRQDANLHLYSVLNTEMKINRNGIQNSLCAYFKLCCCWCCYVVVFIRFRARFPFQSISTRVFDKLLARFVNIHKLSH